MDIAISFLLLQFLLVFSFLRYSCLKFTNHMGCQSSVMLNSAHSDCTGFIFSHFFSDFSVAI